MATATIKGTCPACFRLMALAKNGTLARHGWSESGGRRVGQYHHAWHSGACFGVGWKPFEISPEGTIAYIKHLDKIKRGAETRLEWLATYPMLTLHLQTPRGRRGDDDRLPFEVRLRPGDPERSAYKEGGGYGLTPYGRIPSYESAWKDEATSWKARLDAVTREISDCERRVEKWTPGEVKAHTKQGPLWHLKETWTGSDGRERMKLACGLAYHIGYSGGTRRATSDPSEVSCPKCLATLKKNTRRSRPRLRRSHR